MAAWIDSATFAGKHVTVMGLGAFGGQIGAVRYLVAKGAHVLVTDLKDERELRASLDQLAGFPVHYRLGGHRIEDFRDTDLVLPSPAVKPTSEFLQAAREASVPVESEMGLFVRYCPCEIVGVTGTNGKSTTTSLIGEMATRDARRRAWVGGNIGGSVLEVVGQIGPRDVVVLELSSFQLQALDGLGRSPHVAVVTNFSANHLDHHATMEEYRGAKLAILRHQTGRDLAVLNRDDGEVRTWGGHSPGATRFFSVEQRLGTGAWCDAGRLVCRLPGRQEIVLPRSDLRPPARHNVANALAAIAASALAGVSPEAIAQGLRAFRGLEHRLEFVGERDRVRYYNDSKATTPAAGVIGLGAFSEPGAGPLIVIAGGHDKHVPMDAFATACARRAKHVVVLGQVRELLAELLRGAGPTVTRAESFEDAVRQAQAAAEAGDIVLLSPACASYDMFSNYEERGLEFKRLVMEG